MEPQQTTAQHIFVACQAGAEKALKAEIAREHPQLRFGFSRPGFVTFKAPEPVGPDFELKSVFARAYGLSAGIAKEPAVGDRVQRVLDLARDVGATRLHVFERDFHEPDSEPKGFEPGQLARKVRALISFEPASSEAVESEMVLDVVVVEEDQWWLGFHRHAIAHHHPWPGGRPEIEFPADAPSRAYLKLEEALLWSRAPIRAGDQAVEIGSAPGGASYALLRRGVNVVGIDPGEMDRRVLDFKDDRGTRYEHISRAVASVPREELPARVDWLLLDMNVEPRVSLFAVDRLGTRMKDSLQGVLLTVKLNQWKFADEIPSMIDHLRAMGMVRIRATQLAHNRREFFLYGLTQKGWARARG